MEMACNISNALRDVTIELTASGKTRAIFSRAPPGNNFKDSWWLHIQGGQARLVITGAQDVHAGQYLWKLHGLQRNSWEFVLNVTGEKSKEGPSQLSSGFRLPPHKQGPCVSAPTALPTLFFPGVPPGSTPSAP